jgi:Ion channel
MMESFDGEPPEVPLAEGDVESGPVTSGPSSIVKNEDGTASTTMATHSLHNAVTALAGVPKEQTSFPAEDDDMGEASEIFVDEPEDLTPRSKQGRRIRGKLPTVTFSSPATQTSYWSSDDDNIPNSRSREGKIKKSRMVSPFTGRSKKSRNKRRSRRQQEQQSGSSSDSDEGPHPPQRKASPAPKSSPKPPIAVVRTKSKTNTSSNSNQTHTTATNSPIPTKARLSPAPPIQHLSIEDMEICQRLDDEYENALEERHIGYMARYTSVRQAACLSVVFMLVFLMLGTTFFMRYADWTIHDSLLFSIYTITTVGYGNQAIPKESGFQTFTILYIFVGIAMLTIMVSDCCFPCLFDYFVSGFASS